MGLNKIDGEPLGDLGVGKPVPLEKWADTLDMFGLACASATDAFRKKGVGGKITFTQDDVLVQEYHFQRKIVFLFWKRWKRQDLYAWYAFDLGQEVINEACLTGKWPAIHMHLPNLRAN